MDEDVEVFGLAGASKGGGCEAAEEGVGDGVGAEEGCGAQGAGEEGMRVGHVGVVG